MDEWTNMRVKTLIVLSLTALLIVFVTEGISILSVRGQSTTFQRSSFIHFVKEIFENVEDLNFNQCRYDAKDNESCSLDTLKIIDTPLHIYVGVYHSQVGGIGWEYFQVRLAISDDLLQWNFSRKIEDQASQPTIANAPNGAYLIAFEKHEVTGSSHLKVHYYSNLSMLLKREVPPNFVINISRTLSSNYEGTPNFYNITIKNSLMNACIGFHYYNGTVDEVAVGWLTVNLTNPSDWTWKAVPLTGYNKKLRSEWNVRGHIGDRDYGKIFGRIFTLQEANTEPPPTDYSAWKIFLYDHMDNNFYPLNIKTHKGSTSFGNPTFTFLKSPNGNDCIVVTYFLFSEGAKSGEAGQLIFFKEFKTESYRVRYEDKNYTILLTSNSTIAVPPYINEFERSISFNISGLEGTKGYSIIRLPDNLTQDLWSGDFVVLINNEIHPFEDWTDAETTYIYTNYYHSVDEISITIVPELRNFMYLIFAYITVATLMLRRKTK